VRESIQDEHFENKRFYSFAPTISRILEITSYLETRRFTREMVDESNQPARKIAVLISSCNRSQN
jgi:hypothetical protein